MNTVVFTSLLIAASRVNAVPVDGIVPTLSPDPTIRCNWTGVAEAVRDIQSRRLNITVVVAQCANVCDMIYGSEILYDPNLA